MALADSNTFSTPAAARTLALSRIDFNDSLQAVLQNFYSDATPISTNIKFLGTGASPLPNGALFRSSITGALYVSDSVNQKGNPVHGGNFTRFGIGNRLEESLGSADFTTYEIGETFVTPGANARMYMLSSNTGPTITDIGLPVADSITAAMIKTGAVTLAKIETPLSQLKISKTGQNDFSNAGITITAATGNVHLGFTATNDSNASINYDRTGNIFRFQGQSEGTLVPTDSADVRESGNSLLPVGCMITYGGASAPAGWLLCDGSSVSQSTFADLFAIIGTTYGNPGGGNFGLPNLSGRSAVGVSAQQIRGNTSTKTLSAFGRLKSITGGAHDHTNVFDSVSAGVKDAGAIEVLTDILTSADHTHLIDMVFTVVNYIIKT